MSKLSELRATFSSPTSEEEIPFTPTRVVTIVGPVAAITFASNDSRLLVVYTQGSTAVYDTRALSTPGTDAIQPLHVFRSQNGVPPRDVIANPGDLPDLVAILFETTASLSDHVIELLDVQKLEVAGGWGGSGTAETTPSASRFLRSKRQNVMLIVW